MRLPPPAPSRTNATRGIRKRPKKEAMGSLVLQAVAKLIESMDVNGDGEIDAQELIGLARDDMLETRLAEREKRLHKRSHRHVKMLLIALLVMFLALVRYDRQACRL